MPLSKMEKQEFERLLKPLKDLITEKKEHLLLDLSEDDQQALQQLKDLLKKATFSILKGDYFNFTGIAGWFLFGKIMNKKMLGSGEMSAFNKIVPLAKAVDKIFGGVTGLSIIVTGIKN